MLEFDMEFEDCEDSAHRHGVEENLDHIEPSARDRRAAYEVYQAFTALMMGLDARNQDTAKQLDMVTGESDPGEEPVSRFVPMETAADNFSNILFTGLAPHVMRLLMTDPADALRTMVEHGVRVGLVAGHMLGSAGVTFAGVTVPDLQQLPEPAPEKIEQHAKKIARFREHENNDVCPCPKCGQIRGAVAKMKALGVTATFRKIAGVASMEIDDETVTTPELKHQVDEILGSLSVTAAGETEGPSTGMYL